MSVSQTVLPKHCRGTELKGLEVRMQAGDAFGQNDTPRLRGRSRAAPARWAAAANRVVPEVSAGPLQIREAYIGPGAVRRTPVPEAAGCECRVSHSACGRDPASGAADLESVSS